jgi:hypothetical protein
MGNCCSLRKNTICSIENIPSQIETPAVVVEPTPANQNFVNKEPDTPQIVSPEQTTDKSSSDDLSSFSSTDEMYEEILTQLHLERLKREHDTKILYKELNRTRKELEKIKEETIVVPYERSKMMRQLSYKTDDSLETITI